MLVSYNTYRRGNEYTIGQRGSVMLRAVGTLMGFLLLIVLLSYSLQPSAAHRVDSAPTEETSPDGKTSLSHRLTPTPLDMTMNHSLSTTGNLLDVNRLVAYDPTQMSSDVTTNYSLTPDAGNVLDVDRLAADISLHKGSQNIALALPEKAAGVRFVTLEIRAHIPEASTAWLVWGTNGWHVIPEIVRLSAQTLMRNDAFLTPMTRNEDTFAAKIHVRSGSMIFHAFLLTKDTTGNPINKWYADGYQIYQTAARDGMIEVKPALTENTAICGNAPWHPACLPEEALAHAYKWCYDRRMRDKTKCP